MDGHLTVMLMRSKVPGALHQDDHVKMSPLGWAPNQREKGTYEGATGGWGVARWYSIYQARPGSTLSTSRCVCVCVYNLYILWLLEYL